MDFSIQPYNYLQPHQKWVMPHDEALILPGVIDQFYHCFKIMYLDYQTGLKKNNLLFENAFL